MTPLKQARRQVASDLLTLAQRDAVMAIHGITFPRTHSLEELHRLLTAADYTSPLPISALANLTPYALSTRYDLDSPVESSP
jgi:hypothetical protein